MQCAESEMVASLSLPLPPLGEKTSYTGQVLEVFVRQGQMWIGRAEGRGCCCKGRSLPAPGIGCVKGSRMEGFMGMCVQRGKELTTIIP